MRGKFLLPSSLAATLFPHASKVFSTTSSLALRHSPSQHEIQLSGKSREKSLIWFFEVAKVRTRTYNCEFSGRRNFISRNFFFSHYRSRKFSIQLSRREETFPPGISHKRNVYFRPKVLLEQQNKTKRKLFYFLRKTTWKEKRQINDIKFHLKYH